VGLSFSWQSIYEIAPEVYPILNAQCHALLSNMELFNQLKAKKYKVAVIDLIGNECGLALLHNLGVPAVGYWALPFASGEPDFTTGTKKYSIFYFFSKKITTK